MKFCVPLKGLIAALLTATATAAEAEIAWRESYYNPVPAEGDLVLPMPCDGAMVFRPVLTPNAGGAIGDIKVTLGQEGEDTPYLNGLRRSYVTGGFPSEDATRGMFWLGKYEIAEAQWDVVMSETCPDTPRRRGFVPAVERSALELAQFAEAYTLWLMQNSPDSLPAVGATRAYLRLPTEDEWEFAARGGLAVEDAAFRSPRPVIADGEEYSEYIAHGGTNSAGGKVQVIGTLKPNALGLHDMLGNAGEIVQTPFSLIRHGRLHGQAGGIIKRGGDARTPLEAITSATRFEVPPFDLNTNAVSADRFTGGRLAIAALAITSSDQTDQIAEDLSRISQIDTGGDVGASEAEVDEILTRLGEDLTDPRSQRQLETVKETIAAARAERNAQRDRSIRLISESGTLMCDQVVQRLLNARGIAALLPSYDELEAIALRDNDTVLLNEIEEARVEGRQRIDRLQRLIMAELTEYTNIVEGLADEYSLPLLNRQIALIEPEVFARGARRELCLIGLQSDLSDRVAAGFIDIEDVQRDMRDIAVAMENAN